MQRYGLKYSFSGLHYLYKDPNNGEYIKYSEYHKLVKQLLSLDRCDFLSKFGNHYVEACDDGAYVAFEDIIAIINGIKERT